MKNLCEILIVDSYPEYYDSFCDEIKKHSNYSILRANYGFKAIEIINKCSPKFIIIDWELPDIETVIKKKSDSCWQNQPLAWSASSATAGWARPLWRAKIRLLTFWVHSPSASLIWTTSTGCTNGVAWSSCRSCSASLIGISSSVMAASRKRLNPKRWPSMTRR